MSGPPSPKTLSRFVLERLNAGDVDGLVALYEPDAVLALPDGRAATGHAEIRQAYEGIVAGRPTFAAGRRLPGLRNGELALTATQLPGGAVTAEVARQRPDGTWLWVLDQPTLLRMPP
ncbi:YybH family protein [Flindersiella endophytica]